MREAQHPRRHPSAHRGAARITRGARQVRLRIDATWRWAAIIATAWQAIRTAFG
ncbi:hypothetical protein MBRU_17150 [Mycolicibacterium brumae DSM 44177]|nr:hypothetical protein MBRU_17150 [Mycolicibacterium brumae DSM 44177]